MESEPIAKLAARQPTERAAASANRPQAIAATRAAKFTFGVALLLLLAALLVHVGLTPSSRHQTHQAASTFVSLDGNGQLFRDVRGIDFPSRRDQLTDWLAGMWPEEKVSLLGGSYWLHARVQHAASDSQWVIDVNNSLINQVEARFFGPNGEVQRVLTGYQHDHEYMLHYGKEVRLQPNQSYDVLIRFESPYFASFPRFELLTERDYRQKVLKENVLIVGALGAVLALALFYLFIYSLALDKSQLYYSLYLIFFFVGWAFVFHLPVQLFGLRDLRLHYLPFFMLSPLSAMFCVDFLKLRQHFPKLARACDVVAGVSLLAAPVCFFGLSYAHIVATVVISIWLPLALVCGIASLRRGYRPARYFVVAFLALMVPGAIILPANLGLTRDLVDNAELLTLLGGTLDAMLLAFALADKIKLLEVLKDAYTSQLAQALDLAHTDSMTGIGNRHAFDKMLDEQFKYLAAESDQDQHMLILVDLDGLKQVNDRHGHARGDELLRLFARELKRLEIDGVSTFRLGGDEFTICARRRHEPILRQRLVELDRQLGAQGFHESGVSFGIAYASESASPAEIFNYADSRMYAHKVLRRSGQQPAVSLS